MNKDDGEDCREEEGEQRAGVGREVRRMRRIEM